MKLSNQFRISDNEIQYEAIRSQGPGGQNVNKVSTAIQLRFDVLGSTLPDSLKEAIMACNDRRISNDGVIVIKAQRFRSQEKNREDARTRLKVLLLNAITPQKKRKPTRPSKASKERRLESKMRQGERKKMRGRIQYDE